MPVTPDHVLAASAYLVETFAPHVDRDWSVRADGLEWDCRATLLHSADLWYSVELATEATTWVHPAMRWAADLTVTQALDVHTHTAATLAAVMRGTPDGALSFHGQPADAEGFGAMHCDEVLVHGHDIAVALGIAWGPPADVVDDVRRRLFPWGPDDTDPWPALLWCNGRAELPGRPRLTDWSWHPGLLSTWDGQRRTR